VKVSTDAPPGRHQDTSSPTPRFNQGACAWAWGVTAKRPLDKSSHGPGPGGWPDIHSVRRHNCATLIAIRSLLSGFHGRRLRFGRRCHATASPISWSRRCRRRPTNVNTVFSGKDGSLLAIHPSLHTYELHRAASRVHRRRQRRLQGRHHLRATGPGAVPKRDRVHGATFAILAFFSPAYDPAFTSGIYVSSACSAPTPKAPRPVLSHK